MLLFKKTIFITSLILSLCACSSLKAIKEQSIKVDNYAQIKGQISLTYQTDSPIVVAALTYDNGQVNIISQTQIDGNNQFNINLLAGNYFVGAYVDNNNNQVRDNGEYSVMYKLGNEEFTNIELAPKQILNLPRLTINKGDNVTTDEKVAYNVDKINSNIGRVISLDNSMFSRENTNMGLWRPFDFYEQVGGGLMFLQPYDKNKIPVIFVHGISGNPTEFKSVIEALDTQKFQPWILYYPSGVRLNLVSDYLLSALINLESQYGFTQFQLISHSMGGLVTRTFLREHEKANTKFDVSLYVTINSPLYGMKSATSGVKKSPIVIASWRDLATNSEYIKAAHQWRIPANIPYHLFFSYLPGEEGDSLVPLTSQLSLSLQEEATKIYGSEASHAGVLAMPDFVKRLNKIISEAD